MSLPSPNSVSAPQASRLRDGPRDRLAPVFGGLINSVIVEPPVDFAFPGSVSSADAKAIWVWMLRDLGQGLFDFESVSETGLESDRCEAVLPQLIGRARDARQAADASADAAHRLQGNIGKVSASERLPVVLNALRNRHLLAKAQAFGKAINTLTDDAALATALQSMPLGDPPTAALLIHAALGQVTSPTRLITAAIRISGGNSEAAIRRNQLGPLVEGVLGHAQNQLHLIQPSGPFADIDLSCRALERFHRLVRALSGYIEFERNSRWSQTLSALTKSVSERLEPRLKTVAPDINFALRKGREGSDRLDPDRLLAALSGVYLLATVRECKDSLALNALFEQAWLQSGQALELHSARNLELLRENPRDEVIEARLEAGIKMAEVRFNADYAETLRRARITARR